jgi:hypothetical protein
MSNSNTTAVAPSGAAVPVPEYRRRVSAERLRVEALLEKDGGIEGLFQKIEAGRILKDIAKEYGTTYGVIRGITRSYPELLEAAREAQADTLVKDAGEILDEVATRTAPSTADVALAKERSKYRTWVASKIDRATYGDTPAQVNVGVALDVGKLHLDALLQHGRPIQQQTRHQHSAADVIEADYEVVGGDGDDLTDLIEG